MSEPLPPIETRFALGPITDVHHRFLDHYGFLHFDGALDGDEVVQVKGELARIAAQWIETGRKKVNGIPIFYGQRSDGRPFVQRFAFASMFSKTLSHLVKDKRFTPLLALMEPGARIGESEKDGVVVNRYINEKGSIYKRLGWHTDGLRDLFYFRMPDKMLNVGLHLDDVNAADGGLRLIPGSHRQGLFSMCFRKLYFLWHRRDPQEICVETRAGDLTVQDGRLWHRVASSQKTGVAPTWLTASAVAINVALGTITSSPGLMPNASNDKNKASVPLPTPEHASLSVYSANCFSNFPTYEPLIKALSAIQDSIAKSISSLSFK